MRMNINVKLAEHQKIETNRLWLRPFVMSDAADMFEYSSDASNLQFVFNPHPNLAHTSFVIANHFMKEPLGKWAIELKSEQKMIGLIQFSKLVEQKGTAELSYVLHKKYWNQGLMTEVLASVTQVCLKEIGLKQLVLNCDRENLSSIRVAQKVGYKRIGRFKGSTQYNKGRISEFEEFDIKKGNQVLGVSHV